MRFVTAEEMRALDRAAIEVHKIPGTKLMQRAGLAVAEGVRRLARATGVTDLPVVMIAGGGNNGGDIHAAALYLLKWGYKVEVRLTKLPVEISGDPLVFLEQLPAETVTDWSQESDWQEDDPAEFPRGTIFVDGILGTGASGAPRGTAAAAIHWLRRAATVGRIVAVDLPSGVDADSGDSATPHVVADLTICLALPKTGLRRAAALEACGRVEIADIGFPAELNGPAESDGWGMIGEPELRRILPERGYAAHKGDCGRALAIGGSTGLSGAIALATGGMLRSGAGLVSVWTPRQVATTVASLVPEAMVESFDCDWLTIDQVRDYLPIAADQDAVLLGPGLSCRPGTQELVAAVLAAGIERLVLDADALTLLARNLSLLQNAEAEIVLTPHPGEVARLLDCTVAAVQADRPAALRELVTLTGTTVILKGAGTLVSAPGQGIRLLAAGNPGMATGGTGDVLAGIVTGLLAQGMTAFDAACLGAWWHAAAGDLAAWQGSRASLSAGDLLRCMAATALC